MKRKLRITLFVVLVLIVLLIAAVQGVLWWSDLPRRIVVGQLQQTLGLEVTIDELNTGWMGHTEVRGLTASLPVADKPLLEVAGARLNHTALIPLVLGWSLEVQDLDVADPAIHARRRPDGTWNLQQAQRIVSAHLAQLPEQPGPPVIPRTVIRDASLTVEQPNQPPVLLQDIEIRGDPIGDLAYQATLDVPRVGRVQARTGLTSPYSHQVWFNLSPRPSLLAKLGLSNQAYAAEGRWTGQVAGNNLSGQLELARSDLGLARAHGTIGVTGYGASRRVKVDPTGLILEQPALPTPVRITGGEVTADASRLRVGELRLAGLHGKAMVEGVLQLATRTGRLSAQWQGVTLPAGYTHTGELSVEADRSKPAGRAVSADLTLQSEGPVMDAAARVNLSARGPSWTNLAGAVRARNLSVRAGQRAVPYDGLTARFQVKAPVLRVTSLALRGAKKGTDLNGQAKLNWRQQAWTGRLRGSRVPLPGISLPLTQLSVQARGRGRKLTVQQAVIELAGLAAQLSGSYNPALQQTPLQATLALREGPMEAQVDPGSRIEARRLRGQLRVSGRFSPRNLSAEGWLRADGLAARGKVLGDIRMKLEGSATERQVRLEAAADPWLTGQWNLTGRYTPDTSQAELDLAGKKLDFALPARLLGLAEPTLALGQGRLRLSASRLDQGMEGMKAGGGFELLGLHRPPIQAERVTGRIDLSQGMLRVRNLTARQGSGRLSRGRVTVPLSGASGLAVAAKLADWPLSLGADESLTAKVGGQADVKLNLSPLRARGRITLNSEALWKQFNVGRFNLDANLTGEQVQIRQLAGETLGGKIGGGGRIDLAAPMQSNLKVNWYGLKPSRLKPLLPQLKEATGGLAGTLTVAPAKDPRALEPMKVKVSLNTNQLNYRGLPIGDGWATAWLRTKKNAWQLQRAVLEDFTLEAVGGRIRAYARASKHPRTADNPRMTWETYTKGELSHISLEKLTTALRPKSAPILGQVGLEFTLSAPFNGWSGWSQTLGQGQLTLRNSDLGNLPLFDMFYNIMNLQLGGTVPEGTGQARFRMQDGMVIVPRATYKNHGAEIVLSGRAMDIDKGRDSPIQGYAVLSVKPLPDTQILSGLNQVLSTIQSSLLTSVRLKGTLRNPGFDIVPLSIFQNSLGNLFHSRDGGG